MTDEINCKDYQKIPEIEEFEVLEPKGEPNGKSLEQLKQLDRYPKEVLNMLFTALRDKKAGNITGSFETEELEEFVQLLRKLGLNVVYGKAEVENGVVADIYFSKQYLDIEQIKEVKPDEKSSEPERHRKSGRFYGFPEEDIEAFYRDHSGIFNRLRMKLMSISHYFMLLDRKLFSGHSLTPGKAVEKYGEDLGEKEKLRFKALTFHAIENSEESFGKAREKAKERSGKLEEVREEYGVDFTEEIERMEDLHEEWSSD